MVRVCSWLVAAFLVSAPAFSQLPPRDNGTKTGTARIRGHVFATDTGAPLRKAQVRAFSPELRENRLATTDAQGGYEFKDLPAGRYNLSASKGSYVALQYGQTRPLEQGKPINVLDGQTIEKVDFSLPRGGIVTGRIVDDFGEPIADVQVMPMRYQFMQGRRRLMPIGRSAATNDIGGYRLFGLPPGQYYLSATLRSFMMGDSEDRSGYAPTYYPGTANPAEAQRITVDLGQSMSDVNMALVSMKTARVSGSAVDSQGRPLTVGVVMAMPRGATAMMFGPSATGQIKPDGTFSISGLAPGEYTLRGNTGMPGPDGPELATAEVTVSGDDVVGVRLAATTPITATGRLVVPDAAAAQSLRPANVRLMLQPANPDDAIMMGPSGGAARDDFSFEVKAHPGRFLMRIPNALPGWTLKAVRYNGVDVTDSGIDFTGGSDVSGIEVELSNRPQEISGLVTNRRGETVKDYSVVIFSQDRERWTGNTRYQAVSRPDQDGRFKVRSLPPGEYYAVALDYVDQGEWNDPEFLDRIRTKATSFSLNESETKTLDLRIQTGS